jgi:hypothetical protein
MCAIGEGRARLERSRTDGPERGPIGTHSPRCRRAARAAEDRLDAAARARPIERLHLAREGRDAVGRDESVSVKLAPLAVWQSVQWQA